MCVGTHVHTRLIHCLSLVSCRLTLLSKLVRETFDVAIFEPIRVCDTPAAFKIRQSYSVDLRVRVRSDLVEGSAAVFFPLNERLLGSCP